MNITMKNYNDMTKEELLDLVKELQSRKKYGLVWEDKPEDVVEQCKKMLPVLEEVSDRAIEKKDNGVTNLLIEGDNYHALSVLNYTHQGKIDFIYIDPPYNTGARDWKYNNDYVDRFDSYRHSKWLSFMNHRLVACKNLLREEGVICVTVDDYEMHHLWMLMEEVFGEANHLGTVVIRNNPKGRMTKRKFSLVHEYALFFGKTEKSYIKKLPVMPEEKSHNYKQDKDGTWYLPVNLRKQGIDSNAINRKGILSERYFPIYFDPETNKISVKEKLKIEIMPIDTSGERRIWRRSMDVIEKMYKSGDLWVQKSPKNGYQLYFKFRGGLDGRLAQSMWVDTKFSASEYGTIILDKILGKRELFQYPKSPYAVMESILSATNNPNAIVLDFFAGSGTTADAIIQLNKEDGGNRQFILCTNNENGIAEEVTYPRVKNIIEGYADVEGIPANLRYFKTTFVPQADVSDDTRRELVKKSTEMICVKEGTYKKVYDNKKYKVYKNDERLTGILFDLDSITEFKEKVEASGLPANLYIFSLSNDTFDDDFADLKSDHSLCPIPESILEVYRKLFA